MLKSSEILVYRSVRLFWSSVVPLIAAVTDSAATTVNAVVDSAKAAVTDSSKK